MTRNITLTLDEDQAYALKKTLGISLDNLRGKLSRYKEGSKEHGIAALDFEQLRGVEANLINTLNEG